VHGVRGEALTGGRKMEEEMDKGKKKEDMDPIMMKEDQIKKIMEKDGKTRNGAPYQYKMNNKKRAITNKEGLASNEEEVEDLRAMEDIEEILRATYERKTGGPKVGT
jgi:SPX domain protein involved in polyphosphate accumulation